MSATSKPSTARDDVADLDALWDFDGPAASETRFRALLSRATDENLSRDLLDEVRTQIARALGLQGRFEVAHATLDVIAPRAEWAGALSARPPRLVVRYLLERGRVLNSSGNADEAKVHFIEAWKRARSAGLDALAVDSAHMAAIAEYDSDAALHWNTEALRLAESSADPKARAWRGSLHNNIGWALHARGDYPAALPQFEMSLACRQERGDAKLVSIARWCVARCLRSLGRIDEAMSLQHELLAEHEAAGTGDGFVNEELGECLLALGRAAESWPHFARAHATLSQDAGLAAREPARLARMKRLSRE